MIAGAHRPANASPDSAGAPRPIATRSASRKTATAPTTTRSSAGRTPTIGTSDALMTATPSRAVARVRSSESGVGQDLEPPGGRPVPDEDDADGDDRCRRAWAPTRTGSRRGRRSRPRRRRATISHVATSQPPRTIRPVSANRLAQVAAAHRAEPRADRGPRGMRCTRPVTGPTPGGAASSRRPVRRASPGTRASPARRSALMVCSASASCAGRVGADDGPGQGGVGDVGEGGAGGGAERAEHGEHDLAARVGGVQEVRRRRRASASPCTAERGASRSMVRSSRALRAPGPERSCTKASGYAGRGVRAGR